MVTTPESRAATGWGLVAIQGLLLVALVLLPRGSDWGPSGLLRFVWGTCVFGGLAIALGAALRLGRSLTPTPVPAEGSSLETGGPYRGVRHPIYSGVLLVVLGLVIRSGSLVHLAIGVVTVVFFDRKAAWEERMLIGRYPDYASYRAATPKFVPRLPGWRPRH